MTDVLSVLIWIKLFEKVIGTQKMYPIARKELNFLSKLIEDIYFFEVNTKYISLSVLKTSEFS